MGSREIKVGAIQMKTMPNSSREEKVEHSLPLIEQASKDGCKIILHGELCTTDYDKFYQLNPSTLELAEPIPGPTTRTVGELTKKYKNYVIMPVFEKNIPGIYYNSAAVIGPQGEVIGIYRKTHLASARVLERLYFRSGNGFYVWETEFPPFAKFGIIICFDRRHPEPPRILATMGAEIMFCPAAAVGYAGGQIQWDAVNISRSIDTGMYTVYANRAGKELEFEYFGQSMIVNPHGEVIVKAKDEQDIVVSAVLDLDEVDKARIAHPLLREMRNDLYARYYSHPKYEDVV
jgi:N-carbamoylputrescine amidase